MAKETGETPVGEIRICSAIPGEKDVVLRFGLEGMRQLARAALNRVRELEAQHGCKVQRCGMCGRKARVG